MEGRYNKAIFTVGLSRPRREGMRSQKKEKESGKLKALCFHGFFFGFVKFVG